MAMMAIIFIAEICVMLLFAAAGQGITIGEGLLDAALLALLIAPAMYLLLLKPMQKQQQQLSSSNAWLKHITDHLPDALICLDDRGMICSFNPAAEAMFGIPAKEAIGRSAGILMRDQDARGHDRDILDAMRTGKSETGIRKLEMKRSNGEVFPVEIHLGELKSDQRSYFIAILRDLNERRAEELRRQRMEERIERARHLESLGVLAGGIAHDFNNILTAIMGNAELLRMKLSAPDREQIGYLHKIESSCQRAADLCQKMLAYAGKGRMISEPLDISALASEAQALLGANLPRSIQIRMELAEDLPPVRADAGQMKQMVLDLLTNAAEAIEDQTGEIRLSTGVQTLSAEEIAAYQGAESMPPGEYVYLEVQDTGCGIQPGDMTHVFEPFFSTKFIGRGLGMSAVLGILRAHGGGIRIDSKPHEGTTIRVILPPQQRAKTAPAAPEADAREHWRGAGAVLVVDDQKSIREAVGKMLANMGFDPYLAENGEQALDLLAERNGRFSAVLLDFSMPGMSGAEVLEKIRARYPQTKVILASGYGEQALSRHIQTMKPDAFLSKPYRYRQLQEALRQVLA